ncbi:MAG TPA: DNA polymerase ligase N-terminal domain-containing protein [Solirubrobacteraceae bacterium]|nr:DNA polymerase ligase N-terminal domain-containing protein [Solirubrobacteraceae bacterium]
MAPRAIRALLGAPVRVGFAEATRRRATDLGLFGWVRAADDGTARVHAEGPPAAVEELIAFLGQGPRGAGEIEVEDVGVEGHEQFAIRGVSAGAFVVQEHAASTHHFDLRLQVGGVMRSWALPKGPSLDPAVKRLAVEVDDHTLEHNNFEGRTEKGAVVVWDRGLYEHGGRVPWPEALERGHGVFVLHGEKLEGGFALQRTGAGPDSRWLLIKRRDEEARPGSDVVAERPASVLSGRTLEQILRDPAGA